MHNVHGRPGRNDPQGAGFDPADGRRRARDVLRAGGAAGGLIGGLAVGSGATGIDSVTVRLALGAICLIFALSCVFAFLSGRHHH